MSEKKKASCANRAYLIWGLILLHESKTKAEEQSILIGATVPTALSAASPSGDTILTGSFKSFISTADTGSSGPFIEIFLAQRETIIYTVFLLAPAVINRSPYNMG